MRFGILGCNPHKAQRGVAYPIQRTLQGQFKGMNTSKPLLTLPFVLTAFAIELFFFCLALGTRSLASELQLLARTSVFPRSIFHEHTECVLNPRLVPFCASFFVSVKSFALRLYLQRSGGSLAQLIALTCGSLRSIVSSSRLQNNYFVLTVLMLKTLRFFLPDGEYKTCLILYNCVYIELSP